jgi:transcriptional regulator with XRE-family HTH domain
MRGVRRTEPPPCGTREGYKAGCHCEGCTQAARDYKNDMMRAKAYGAWQPFVDAEPVREHLLGLREAHMGRNRVAEVAGLNPNYLARLLYGDGAKPPPRKMRGETAAKILAVTPADGTSPRRATDSTGARRRLEALSARQWSLRRLAAESGLSETTVTAIMRGEQITVASDQAVRAVYDRLWDQLPPEPATPHERTAATQARLRAERKGLAPPAAWDDEQLDLPDGRPVVGWRRSERTTYRAADLAEDAGFVMETETSKPEHIAKRLGISTDNLGHALKRAALCKERELPGGEVATVTQLPTADREMSELDDLDLAVDMEAG